MLLRCTCSVITQGHIAISPSCQLHGTSHLTRDYNHVFTPDDAVGDTIVVRAPNRFTQLEEYSGYVLTPDGFITKAR